MRSSEACASRSRPSASRQSARILVYLVLGVGVGDSIQLDERVFVRRLRVERFGVSELRRVGAQGRRHRRREDKGRETSAHAGRPDCHCLKSMPIRVGVLAVIAIVRRRSPSCGCRHTTSWFPIGSVTFARGVVPISPPSTDTLAQGTALTDSEPVGSATAFRSVFPLRFERPSSSELRMPSWPESGCACRLAASRVRLWSCR